VLSFALAALVASAATGRGVLGTLRLPGAAWIAAISYSLDLSHKLVFQAVYAHFDLALEDAGLLAFAAYAVATVAGGALLHYAVERPFLRLRDGRERRRRAVPLRQVDADHAPVPAPVRTLPAQADAVLS
jgi:peptidoglycan/LPS O-acetylase OafA/YrhL